MIEEENDPALAAEGEEAVEGVEKSIDELQLMTMLNGEYDHSNAILTFHAGTGGTEAQDWAEMLMRMYTRWAEAHGYSVEVLDVLDGDEAGIKSASMMVKGANAYGMLKSEHGVHRLVRVSPFDSQARRQTSFSSLEVMPELDNNINIEINPADIEMQVYRSSGAGGQHINKTSSAVRLIHKPTGIVTSCQTQRSQLQNREYAMEMMKAKLYQIALQQHKDKIDDIKGVQNEIAWGHQIRSYVFMPYTLVKDHRTNFESGNVQAVMDGDLDGFIYAYLKASSRGNWKRCNSLFRKLKTVHTLRCVPFFVFRHALFTISGYTKPITLRSYPRTRAGAAWPASATVFVLRQHRTIPLYSLSTATTAAKHNLRCKNAR